MALVSNPVSKLSPDADEVACLVWSSISGSRLPVDWVVSCWSDCWRGVSCVGGSCRDSPRSWDGCRRDCSVDCCGSCVWSWYVSVSRCWRDSASVCSLCSCPECRVSWFCGECRVSWSRVAVSPCSLGSVSGRGSDWESASDRCEPLSLWSVDCSPSGDVSAATDDSDSSVGSGVCVSDDEVVSVLVSFIAAVGLMSVLRDSLTAEESAEPLSWLPAVAVSSVCPISLASRRSLAVSSVCPISLVSRRSLAVVVVDPWDPGMSIGSISAGRT
jgi:hypothetical protein